MDDYSLDLANFRLDKAMQCINDAKAMLGLNSYASAANRSYYAIFHSARAILALDNIDRKRHSAVISYFQQYYVKTNIFDRKFSKIIQDAFEIRQESDYEDFYVVSREDV
ncbi:MAG: HEPN domain-containing protein, partial [Clostridia bacterium]|nr:HEPN domain-containing protein [Clostridia bacterium]